MQDLTKRYSKGEEIFNSVSHGIGSLLAMAGTAVIIVFAAIYGTALDVVTVSVYGASLITLYTMSTLYHALTNKKAKAFFRIMDHNTIFFLIAGTYTPITLSLLGGPLGWTLFAVVWAAAIIGISLNSADLEKFVKPSMVCYLAMGWIIILAFKPLVSAVSSLSVAFLLLGGVCYTLGFVFYSLKKVKYFHSIWHIFTIAGSAFHYFCILLGIIERA